MSGRKRVGVTAAALTLGIVTAVTPANAADSRFHSWATTAPVAPKAAAAQTVAYVALDSAGGTGIRMACYDGGLTTLVPRGGRFPCFTGEVLVRNPAGFKAQQTNALGYFFDWKTSTGWKRDDDGGVFRLRVR